MGKGLLVIYDLDTGYGEGLFTYLKQKRDFPLETKLITAFSSLPAEEEVSLLVLDQGMEGVELHDNVKQVVYLSEDQEDGKHINRYQAVDKIIERIQQLCKISMDTKKSVITEGKTSMASIIGVYSPIGGCGKTRLAREIASYMGRNDQAAYYLDFELVSNEEGDKRADFFFDLRTREMFKEDNFGRYFSNVNGVNHLCSSLYQSELWDFNEEDMKYLVQGVQEREESACYIFDIGFLNHTVIALLKECDYWVLPYREGDVEESKIRNVERLLRFQGEEALLSRVLRFEVKQSYDELMKKLVL